MRRVAAVVGLVLLAGSAFGQESRFQKLREYIGQFRMQPKQPMVTAPAPQLASMLDGNTFVQVNVDENGYNIVGDAANETSIAVDPTAPNRMVIGWRQFDSNRSSNRQAGYAWTNDGGRSWHFDGVLDPGTFRSDPVLASDADGVFYYYSIRCPRPDCGDLFRSYDGGQTWVGPTPAMGGDKVWMTVDKTNSIGLGNVYAQWDDNFIRSINGGTTFDSLTKIPGRPHWGSICVDPDGLVYVVGLGSEEGGFPIARSSNMRDLTVEPSFDLTSTADLGGTPGGFGSPNPAGLYGQAWIATDHSDTLSRGNVYVCTSVRPDGGELDVNFARSTDQGMSFSAPVRINDDPSDSDALQWFATMSVAPNGRIDIVWNDTRNTGEPNISELFYSFSTDQGQTWSANVQLTGPWDSHVGWPRQKKIGDYYHMVSDDVGANLAWAATFNGEQDVFFLRIGEYDCNGNGVSDELDFLSGFATDHNDNGIPDSCDIASGLSTDKNNDGVPDEYCYADCETDEGPGVLNLADFLCFQTSFMKADPYACDCDTSTGPATCDVLDFLCYQTAFIQGCP